MVVRNLKAVPRAHFALVLLAGVALACSGKAFEGSVDEADAGVSAPTPDASAGTSTGASSLGGGGTAGVVGTAVVGTAGGGAQAAAGSAALAGAGGTAGDDAVGAGGSDVLGAGGDEAAGAGGAGEPVVVPLELIDDLEAGFPSIPEISGRNGFWYIADDATSQSINPLLTFPVEPPRPDSDYATGLSGAGFTFWGALLGVTFRSPFAAYDASDYCGVRFVARGYGEGWALRITDRQSEPDGGVCVNDCYNHLGQQFQPGEEWQEYEFHFADLEPTMSNGERALDTAAVYSIVFAFENASGAEFELLVDDLAFIPTAGCQ